LSSCGMYCAVFSLPFAVGFILPKLLAMQIYRTSAISLAVVGF